MEKNNIDKNLYNEKSLYLLNIRELRDIGRKFCVPSPTTMKKRDLVDYILKVVYGEINPPIRNSCGRPSSREFNMSKYIDKINKNKDLTEQLKEVRLDFDEIEDSKFVLKVAAPKNQTYIGEIVQRVVFMDEKSCQLRVRQFVESDDDISIDLAQAKVLKLENFDVVETVITSGGIKIISVNGKRLFKSIEPFEVCNENIAAGSRKVFHLRTKEKIKENIQKIKTACKEQQLKLVTFGTEDILEETEDSFIIQQSDSDSKKYKKFMMFVEYCKHLVYENKDFVVLIQEKTDVQHLIESLDLDVSQRAKQHLNEDVKNLVKLGNILLTFNLVHSVIY